MKVIVFGAGVIGVTTAYYLARAGHEVEVIDRGETPACETSFANAGQISPGYASPWAGPGVPLKALKWLTMHHGPLVIRPKMDPAMWTWMFTMLRNCTSSRYAVNKSRMVPLAEYSRDCLRALRQETAISYDERSQGTLQLFRSQKQLESVARDVDVLKELNVPFQVLDRNGCILNEPALGDAPAGFAGGLRLPGDETGDCRLFTERLAGIAGNMGVRFSFGTELFSLAANGRGITSAITSTGRRSADAYVIALGSCSPAMLRPLGISLPIYPVKGYSLTIPITDGTKAPNSTVMDETYKTAITRLGNRIRVGGTAELAGFDKTLHARRRAGLEHSFGDLFPFAGDVRKATFWSGLRPMTPDGPPIIGATPLERLYLNTGHGTLGWTMACGSGKVVCDIISSSTPDLDVAGLGMSRFMN